MHVEADCDLERAADGLPGAELVVPGMRDLREGRISEASLLVSIAAPRIRRLGFHVPDIEDVPWPYERQLYALLGRNGVPTVLPRTLALDALIRLIRDDNKIGYLPRREDHHVMVLLRHLGQPVEERPGLPLTYVSERELRTALATLRV